MSHVITVTYKANTHKHRGSKTQPSRAWGVNICAVQALDRGTLLTSALCHQIMKYSKKEMEGEKVVKVRETGKKGGHI